MSLGVFSLLALPRIEVKKCNGLISADENAGDVRHLQVVSIR
jgi:hypothetical protein